VIIYVPPSISTKIREMRHDQHWYVIDDYASIWDMPNNKHQRHNFTHVQPRLFDDFERKPGVVGWEP
jgi:ketosteroid isomerase-like protein